MVVDPEVSSMRVPRGEAGGEREPRLRDGVKTLLVSLNWGLGDVLLSTSALREWRRRWPDTRIIYRTYMTARRRKLLYALGSPSQMLEHNQDIDQVIDAADQFQCDESVKQVEFHYAHFGGPSLDYPIQAHYWENLQLLWTPGQRFDAVYHVTGGERAQARRAIGKDPTVVITPGGGWPGKAWTNDGWRDVMSWAVAKGLRPVVLAGERVDDTGFIGRGIVNLSAQTDIRQAAAIIAEADYAVMTEGGPSNLRFALGKRAILLTCATQVGVQIWTPPELTVEVRFWMKGPNLGIGEVPACDPCMWRREHVQRQRSDVPPANTKHCPEGVSLRDMPSSVVIDALEKEMNRG